MTNSVQTKTVGNKENKAFMILSALGILFVVDDHLGKSLSLFTQIFPYDSFFMPMFCFISGYFFSEKHAQSWKNVISFSIHKFKKWILPYLGWILFYGILTALLRRLDILEMGAMPWWDLTYNILTSGTSYGFNSASWFVPTLFCVAIVYCGIKRLFRRPWKDTLAMCIFALLGAAAVYVARTEYNTGRLYMPLKILFYLQFYHLGVFFRNKIEPWFDRTSGVKLCTGAVIVNLILQSVYGDAIAFPVCSSMSGFYTDNLFLPLITSITGIAFWLKISKTLVPALQHNPLVNFISDNTFFIMTHHVGVKHLFLGLLMIGSRCGLEAGCAVDVYAFRTDPWYVVTEPSWVPSACFLFTMFVLVLSCKAFHAAKNWLPNPHRSSWQQKEP